MSPPAPAGLSPSGPIDGARSAVSPSEANFTTGLPARQNSGGLHGTEARRAHGPPTCEAARWTPKARWWRRASSLRNLRYTAQKAAVDDRCHFVCSSYWQMSCAQTGPDSVSVRHALGVRAPRACGIPGGPTTTRACPERVTTRSGLLAGRSVVAAVRIVRVLPELRSVRNSERAGGHCQQVSTGEDGPEAEREQ
jgi:hypothetical protein